jgi:hypothetical protein
MTNTQAQFVRVAKNGGGFRVINLANVIEYEAYEEAPAEGARLDVKFITDKSISLWGSEITDFLARAAEFEVHRRASHDRE